VVCTAGNIAGGGKNVPLEDTGSAMRTPNGKLRTWGRDSLATGDSEAVIVLFRRGWRDC
jgi:hypothetical protein